MTPEYRWVLLVVLLGAVLLIGRSGLLANLLGTCTISHGLIFHSYVFFIETYKMASQDMALSLVRGPS